MILLRVLLAAREVPPRDVILHDLKSSLMSLLLTEMLSFSDESESF